MVLQWLPLLFEAEVVGITVEPVAVTEVVEVVIVASVVAPVVTAMVFVETVVAAGFWLMVALSTVPVVDVVVDE